MRVWIQDGRDGEKRIWFKMEEGWGLGCVSTILWMSPDPSMGYAAVSLFF